jgi:tetratricopeptide (TPR) repeat protein
LTNEPVTARPPSAAYRFQKLVRRNRGAFAAAVVVGLVLAGSIILSTWQAVRATRAQQEQSRLRQKAEREAALRQEAARFLAEVFSSNFKRVEPGTDTSMMREILDFVIAQLDASAPRDEHIRYTLALAYWAIRDDVRAERLMRDALEIARRGLAENNPRVQSRMLDIVWFLNDFRRHAEREALITEVLTSATPIRDAGARLQLIATRGFVRAMQGKWKEGADDFATCVQLNPENPDWHHHLAPLLVRMGDREDYNRHRQASLARFAEVDDPVAAERIAKDALMLPLRGPELDEASRLADVAAAADASHWAWTWFQHVKALAEFRQGRYAAAIEWGKLVLEKEGAIPERDIQACMIVAMAQAGLRHDAEARAMLARGTAIAQLRLETLESQDVGDDWIDWIYAHALMDEAKGIIEGRREPRPPGRPNGLPTEKVSP